jgi:hypothetical protein
MYSTSRIICRRIQGLSDPSVTSSTGRPNNPSNKNNNWIKLSEFSPLLKETQACSLQGSIIKWLLWYNTTTIISTIV